MRRRGGAGECSPAGFPGLAEDPADEGFMLVAVVVLVFLVLLALSVAAPRVAMQMKHDQEIETQHRANQYVRAIRMYYKKFQHYPGSIEQLDKSNNQRFLRQHYLDPLTGKDDWKLIVVGQNKTKVKGFFGEELPGIGEGLGAAGGVQGGGSTNPPGGTPTPPAAPPLGGAPGTPGTGAPGSSGGIGEQNATDFTGGAGPIMGVGVPKSGEAFITVNEQTNYPDWEFLYDPRIEQLYAKGNLLGGGGVLSGAPGLGTGTGTGSPFGTPPGQQPSPTPGNGGSAPPTPQ